MARQEQSLTPQEQAKLKAFAQGLPDEPGDIDVDAIAQETGTSRRQVLQIIAAVGVGSIAGGVSVSQLVSEAQAQASTSDGDGNVGTPADRVDVFADGVDASVIDTENANIGGRQLVTLDPNGDLSSATATDTLTISLADSYDFVQIRFNSLNTDSSGTTVRDIGLQVNGVTSGYARYRVSGSTNGSEWIIGEGNQFGSGRLSGRVSVYRANNNYTLQGGLISGETTDPVLGGNRQVSESAISQLSFKSPDGVSVSAEIYGGDY